MVLLADCPGRSELEHSPAMRFRSGHAGADIVCRLLREVFLHFFQQALVGSAAT
jgi:hypothetical protein